MLIGTGNFPRGKAGHRPPVPLLRQNLSSPVLPAQPVQNFRACHRQLGVTNAEASWAALQRRKLFPDRARTRTGQRALWQAYQR